MRLDNAMRDGHAQADAFFRRRKKWLEDALLLFRRHAAAGILERDGVMRLIGGSRRNRQRPA